MEKTTIVIPPKNTQSVFANMRGAHVALRVSNYDETKKWYMEKLDFRLLHEWPFGDLQLAYLAPANDDTFWIELLAGGNPEPKTSYQDLNESLHPAGYHHICMDVKSVDDTLAQLRNRGVTILGDAFDLPVIGKRLGFFSDLWGNVIELSETL
ncbi:VOC family protein [Cytophagaceae bacterium YF14B1]|uniref:VOC family protein n=1 Tax=Xanthocytophaga flava TaxID=3048013 RepID=A0AAE3U8L9_9BACT|nr:VOC family protein [Xanthocytophaga flavus]MDJ1481323.1 VOC family protein [Xanthocytophaga flavus]